MPSNDYKFDILADTLEPFGPVHKENLDIIRLLFDFHCWLEDDGDLAEPIAAVSYPVIGVEPKTPIPPWQNDYPLDNSSVTAPPAEDTYPLSVMSVAISTDASRVEVRLQAGTPGLTYVISVIGSSATTKRRKQVDCFIYVEPPINPSLVSLAAPDITDITPPLIVSGTTTLPLGFEGRIYIENSSGAPFTITLPVTPQQAQRVAPVDILGNAHIYPITFAGAPGDTIYSSPTYVMNANYDDIIFEWVGDHWIVLNNYYSFFTSIYPSIQVTSSHVLAAGEAGNVFVSGLTGAATITLPPLPLVLGHQVMVKNSDGSAATYPITVQGAAGAMIDDMANYVIGYGFASARFTWSGSRWSLG